jgi:hypothetical protein
MVESVRTIVRGRRLWEEEIQEKQRQLFGDSLDKFKALGQSVAIVGLATDRRVKFLDLKIDTHRVWLDGGQFIDEAFGGEKLASGGRQVEIRSVELSFIYAIAEACRYGIEFVHLGNRHPCYLDPYCMKASLADAFMDALSEVDATIQKWEEKRSMFSRWFGSIYPTEESDAYVFEEIKARLSQIYER